MRRQWRRCYPGFQGGERHDTGNAESCAGEKAISGTLLKMLFIVIKNLGRWKHWIIMCTRRLDARPPSLRTPIRAQANSTVPRPARSCVERQPHAAKQTLNSWREGGRGCWGGGPSAIYGLSSTGFSAQCSDWIRSECFHHVKAVERRQEREGGGQNRRGAFSCQ